MLNVGINGFGRIGKCVFLQLLELKDINIKVINTSLEINSIEKYINRDSIHGKRNHICEINNKNEISVKGQKIKIVNSRNIEEINWRDLGAEYLFETSGAYLTKEKLKLHPVDYVILSSPPKDDIDMFCYGVNHNKYKGQEIISTASCTTNCITPLLKFCNDFLGKIEEGSFITIHSATSSQNVVDKARDKKRTCRSIFNNIIPHTTGASKSIDLIFPEIKGKIKGTSVRVPVSNVSMVDVNLRFYNKVNKEDFFKSLEKVLDDRIISINMDDCVSCDFIGNKSPTIIDYKQCNTSF